MGLWLGLGLELGLTVSESRSSPAHPPFPRRTGSPALVSERPYQTPSMGGRRQVIRRQDMTKLSVERAKEGGER